MSEKDSFTELNKLSLRCGLQSVFSDKSITYNDIAKIIVKMFEANKEMDSFDDFMYCLSDNVYGEAAKEGESE